MSDTTNTDLTFDFTNFLPVVNQTDTLVKFFGASVNQLFQPGNSKTISGYIGEVPNYNNPKTDFYITEPTASRSAYQLEPGMVSITTTTTATTVNNALTYPDFVSYLSNSGGITTNQQRLFENNYYSWAPPIDIDKIANYTQYHWFGGILDSLPVLKLTPPTSRYTATAGQTTFTAPSIDGFIANPIILVNGTSVPFSYDGNHTLTLITPANAGDIVVTSLYNTLLNSMTINSVVDLTNVSNYFVSYTGNGEQKTFASFNPNTLSNNSYSIGVYLNGVLQTSGYLIDGENNVVFANAPSGTTYSASAEIITIVVYNGLYSLYNTFPTALNTNGIAVSAPATTSGMAVQFYDFTYYNVKNNVFVIDGISSGTRLTSIKDLIQVSAPQFATIERSSIDKNAWSLHNLWFHKSSFAWSGISFSNNSQRPIIEFVKDIVLYSYGRRRVQVDAILTQLTVSYFDGSTVSQIPYHDLTNKPFGSVAVDNTFTGISLNSSIYESGNLADFSTFDQGIATTLEEIRTLDNVGLLGIKQTDSNEQLYINDSTAYLGPNGLNLQPGMVLLILNGAENRLYQVISNAGLINLVPILDSDDADYFTSPQFGSLLGQDICYDASIGQWIVGKYHDTTLQEWKESIPPLFYLYDINGVVLDDLSTYPKSNFKGSKIFSFAYGTGSIDSLVLQPLSYDDNGYIIFENNVVTNRYTYNNGVSPINGFYCYGTYSKTISASVIESCNAIDFFFEDNEEHSGNNYHGTINEVANAQDSVSTFEETAYYYHTTQPLWRLVSGISFQDIAGEFPAIPQNLEANPLQEDVKFISLSDWNEQFTQIISNQIGFNGIPYATNNFRDTAKDLSLGNQIIQNQAPMLKAMLLASTEQFDLPYAIRFAQNEYKKFKNKFLLKITDNANKGILANNISDDVIDPNNPANWQTTPYTWVITTLTQLTTNLNSSFPFALSTMGGGNYFIPPTPAFLGVLPPTTPMFVIDNTFSNQTLFIRGHDGSLTPAFGTLDSNGYSTDWRDYILLELETLIYNNIPSIIENSSFSYSLENFIEKRLNFDIQYWMDNVFFQVPYTNGYSVTEINQMLSPIFQLWVQQGKFDYRRYSGYDQQNPFTWNFTGATDVFGNTVQGSWRAIYQNYFDTDNPAQRPWEMLGFAEIPNWWQDEYGTSYASTNTLLWNDLENGVIRNGPRMGIDPRYARPGLLNFLPVDAYGNLLDPVASGIVAKLPTYQQATQDWQFGDWSPVETLWRKSSSYKFALAEIGFFMKPARYIETLWSNYTGSGNGYIPSYGFINSQWIDFNTNYRPVSSSANIHGETYIIKGKQYSTVVIGIQQWLVDSLVNAGKSPSLLGNAIRNIDVRLLHQMASFVSTDGLKVVSDTFGLFPSEDVLISLYNSPAFDTETYSGVIIEWTGNGYRVIGYDNENAYFTIFPPVTAGSRGYITVGGNNANALPNNWHPNTYYTIGVKVLYDGSIYQAAKAHTSSTNFDVSYWNLIGKEPTQASPSVVVYNTYQSTSMQVPYGTVFNTLQDVSNFLLGWQAYLQSRGWIFDVIDANGDLQNWQKAVYEFLDWSQVRWAPGNFIALSPGAELLKFTAPFGTVLNVEDPITGFFGLVNRSGNPITSDNAYVSRLGPQVNLVATNADIYGARLRVSETEHVLIFSNTTIFGNILYVPLYNMRQARLKLIANTSINWNGRLNAPGYIINGNELVPNFDKNVEDIRTMFDIEKTDRTDFLAYARHNVGYQARSYMENLLLSDVEQFEFFKGMIQAKGSPGVFQALLRSSRINESSNVEFLEEWAIRQSIYGAPIPPRITFLLSQNKVLADPQLIIFDNISNAPATWIQLPLSNSAWFDKPLTSNFFPPVPENYQFKLPCAGPVRLSEVQYASFYVDNLAGYFETAFTQNLSVFNAGERIWIYDINYTWDVWRVFETSVTPNTKNTISMIQTPTENTEVNGMRIYFNNPTSIVATDIGGYVVIDNSTYTTPDLLGVQQIINVGSDIYGAWIEVNTQGSVGYIFPNGSIAPSIRVFRSVRFRNNIELNKTIVYYIGETGNAIDISNIDTVDALNDGSDEAGNLFDSVNYSDSVSNDYWIVDDLVWIDNDNNTGQYAVRQWDGTEFTIVRNQPVRFDATAIKTSFLFENNSEIVNIETTNNQKLNQLVSNQPLIDDFVIVDPLSGLIPGIADREIYYKTDIDPAGYNFGNVSSETWGTKQIGRVWWDLSTCRFLDYCTDLFNVSNERDVAEYAYRISNWAKPAPNTSIDIYEWIESDVSPSDWTTQSANDTSGQYSGTVYNASNPSWAEAYVFDASLGKFVTKYYFWVKNRTITPNVSFRKTDIATVASIITNPSTTGISWLAPINADALAVSGVQSFLDNVSSTVSVVLKNNTEQTTHAEWILIDQNDAFSLPPAWLWGKMRDSLSGFQNDLTLIPNPELSSYRNVGIYDGQSMFKSDGVLDARQSYVGIINNIFARSPIVLNNATEAAYLSSASDPVAQGDGSLLFWSRENIYDPVLPPPYNEYGANPIQSNTWYIIGSRILFENNIYEYNPTVYMFNNNLVNFDNLPPANYMTGDVSSFDPSTSPGWIFVQPVIVVYSGQERNNLVSSQLFLDSLNNFKNYQMFLKTQAKITINGTYGPLPGNLLLSYTLEFPTFYVLLDSINNVKPSWSIWAFYPPQVSTYISSNNPSGNNPIKFLYENAQNTVVLKPAFERVANSYTDMVAGNVFDLTGTQQSLEQISTKIYIKSDITADDFWTIYEYLGLDTNGNNIFEIWRTQTYRTGDFIETVDWYAQNITINNGNEVSYSASNPPTVSYPDYPTLLISEPWTYPTPPANEFVRIGTQTNFQWYVFDKTVIGTNAKTFVGWTVVAQSNGTINLSSKFYETGLQPYAVTNFDKSNIATRDGSWELRVIFEYLRYNILTNAQLNEIFFSMVHFVHTQQNEVDWIFKTSFMTIAGFAIPLVPTGIVIPDPTTSLIEYVNEVKPYRVKVRDYSQQYSVNTDQANVIATDFDLPVYQDPTYKQLLPIVIQMFNDWESNIPYSVGNVVFYNNFYYISIANNNVNVVPPNNNYWKVYNPTGLISTYSNLVAPYSNIMLNEYTTNTNTILSEYPWKYWNNEYKNIPNDVRKITIKLLFDRVSTNGSGYGYDDKPYSSVGFDGKLEYATTTDSPLSEPLNANYTAAARIAKYYDGTAINKVLTFSYGEPDVLGVRFKGEKIDGIIEEYGTFDTEPSGFDSEGFDAVITSQDSIAIDGGTLNIWASGTTYNIGDTIYYNNVLYTCIIANNDSVFNSNNWQLESNKNINALPYPSWVASISYTAGQIVSHNNNNYICLAAHVSGNVFKTDNWEIIGNTIIRDTETLILGNNNPITLPVGGISDPLGYGFADPYIGADVPEERVPLYIDDNVQIAVTSTDLAGAPTQSTHVYDVSKLSGSNTFVFEELLESYISALVYVNGLLLPSTAYTTDTFEYNINYNVQSGDNKLQIQSIGIGSTVPFTNTLLIDATGNATYTVSGATSTNLLIRVNGIRQTNFSVSDGIVTFNAVPAAGAEIQFYVSSATASNVIEINRQELSYKASKKWTLSNRDTTPTPYLSTFVFVNGQRLNTPPVYVGAFADENSFIAADLTPTIHTRRRILYENNGTLTLYTGTAPIITSLSQTAGAMNNPQFAFLGNKLVSQNSNFISNRVELIILGSGSTLYGDFSLSGTVLKIMATVNPGDNIEVITFTNAALMEIDTYNYVMNSTGLYYIRKLPVTNQYSWVSIDGITLSPDSDYNFVVGSDGNYYLNVPNLTGSNISISIFAGLPYRNTISWFDTTVAPSAVRLQPQEWNKLTPPEQQYVPTVTTIFEETANGPITVLPFDEAKSIVNLNGYTPTLASNYSVEYTYMGSTTTYTNLPIIPIVNDIDNFVKVYDPDPLNANLAFLGSTLISQNSNYNAPGATVTVTINDFPVPVFYNISGYAGLIPYYPTHTNPYDIATTNDEGMYQPEFVYTLNNSWEYTRTSVQTSGKLILTLTPTNTFFTISLNQNQNLSTKLRLYEPFPENGGVVWINGERIEYGYALYNGGRTNVTFYELKRATKGTTIRENRVVAAVTNINSVTLQITLNLPPIAISANVFEVVYLNNDTNRYVVVPKSQYSVSVSNYVATFVITSPLANTYYVASANKGLLYSPGTIVYNGTERFIQEIPLGPDMGNPANTAINFLIEGFDV